MKIDEFKIVFIGGIHGVGKSQFSEKVARQLKIPCFSASDLITRQRNAPAAINKRVQNIENNQNALITAIESYSIGGKQFILDGHFCVFDIAGTIQKVPIKTFQQLAPIAVVVLLDAVNQIQQRLYARDKKNFQIEALEQLQETERIHAENVCSRLNIPLCLALTSEQDNAVQFIYGCLNS